MAARGEWVRRIVDALVLNELIWLRNSADSALSYAKEMGLVAPLI